MTNQWVCSNEGSMSNYFIKYPGFTLVSNNCDDADILKQIRMLYCISNRLIRLFNMCSKPVLHELYRNRCTVFYCPYIWINYKKTTDFKIHVRVAYNNVYRKILVCLDVPQLVLCLSLTTFLTLKLFFESLFIYLPLEYHFSVTI